MGDSPEKGTKTVTWSSVAMRTPETIADFTRLQLSGISDKLVQCDQIYDSPTLNKTLGTYLIRYNNHRHCICRVIYIRNMWRAQIKWRHTRSYLAPSHGTPPSKTSLWWLGIPVTLRIDAHRKAYVTPDTHDVKASSIHNATTKNIVRFVFGRCIFFRTPHRAVRFKSMYWPNVF